jgi:hypothetical protein
MFEGLLRLYFLLFQSSARSSKAAALRPAAVQNAWDIAFKIWAVQCPFYEAATTSGAGAARLQTALPKSAPFRVENPGECFLVKEEQTPQEDGQ